MINKEFSLYQKAILTLNNKIFKIAFSKLIMNKKGAAITWVIIIILLVAIIALFIAPRFNEVCTFLDTGGKTPVSPKGAIFVWYDSIQKNYLDPSFQYLFGNTFVKSIQFIAGYKGVCESIVGFGRCFLLALLALFWIVLSKFIIKMVMKIFFIGKGGYWKEVAGSTYFSSVKYLGLLVIFPTFMQVALINRFIQFITFYWLANWLIYSFILAIYVGWLPEIIQSLIYWNAYRKAQKAIFQTKAGAKILRSAGSA